MRDGVCVLGTKDLSICLGFLVSLGDHRSRLSPSRLTLMAWTTSHNDGTYIHLAFLYSALQLLKWVYNGLNSKWQSQVWPRLHQNEQVFFTKRSSATFLMSAFLMTTRPLQETRRGCSLTSCPGPTHDYISMSCAEHIVVGLCVCDDDLLSHGHSRCVSVGGGPAEEGCVCVASVWRGITWGTKWTIAVKFYET